MRSTELHFIEIEFGTPEYDDMVQLRQEILRTPLRLEFTIEQLEKEYQDFLFNAYENDLLLGTCILTPVKEQPKSVQMRQVAVTELCQKKGVGSFLVQECESFAKSKGFEKMILHARDIAVPFYEKLGYTITEGPYLEVNIPHYSMERSFIE